MVRSNPKWLVVALATLTAMTAWSHDKLLASLQNSNVEKSAWFLPSVSSLRLISLGFDRLLADCLWLQFIQYIGTSDTKGEVGPSLVAGMLEDITELDPNFDRAYFFIATIVGGDCHDPTKADQLLRRGIQLNSRNWYIPFMAGVNQYLFNNDEVQAAKYYKMASRFPDAPNWLGDQSQILGAHIPSAVKSVNVWQKVLDSTEDPTAKQRVREELCRLWVHIRNVAPVGSIVRSRAERELDRLGANIFSPKLR